MLSFLGIFDGFLTKISSTFELANFGMWTILETILHYSFSVWDFLSHVSSYLWWYLKSVFVAPNIGTSNIMNLFILIIIIVFSIAIISYIFKGRGGEGEGKIRKSLSFLGNYIFRGFVKYIVVGIAIFAVLAGTNFLVRSILGNFQYGKEGISNQMKLSSDRLLKKTFDIDISVTDKIGDDEIKERGKISNSCSGMGKEYRGRSYGKKARYLFFKKNKGGISEIGEKDKVRLLNNCGLFGFKKKDDEYKKERKIYGLSSIKYEHIIKSKKSKESKDFVKDFEDFEIGKEQFLWKIKDSKETGSGMVDVINLEESNNPQAINFISTLFNYIKGNKNISEIKNNWIYKFINYTKEGNKTPPSLDFELDGEIFGYNERKNIENASIERKKQINLKISLTNFNDRYGFIISDNNTQSGYSLFSDIDNGLITYKNGKLYINDFGLLLNIFYYNANINFLNGEYPTQYLESGFLAGSYFLKYKYKINVSGIENFTFNNLETTTEFKYTPAFVSDLLFIYAKGYNPFTKTEKDIKKYVNQKVFIGEIVSFLNFMNNEEYIDNNKLFSFNSKTIIVGMGQLAGDSKLYNFDYIPLSTSRNNGYYIGKRNLNDIYTIESLKMATNGNPTEIDDDDYKGLLLRFGFIEEINKALYFMNSNTINGTNGLIENTNIYNNALYNGDYEKIFITKSKSRLAIIALIAIWLIFKNFGKIITNIIIRSGAKTGNSGGKNKVWSLNGLFSLLFAISLFRFKIIYSYIIYISFIVLFIGVLLLRRRKSRAPLKGIIDSLDTSIKSGKAKINQKSGRLAKAKLLLKSQVYGTLKKTQNGIRKIKSSDSSTTGGSSMGRPLIVLGIQLIIFVIVLSVSYRIGEIVAISTSSTGNPLDLGYFGGFAGAIVMRGLFFVPLNIQNQISQKLAEHVLGQLTQDRSVFNEMLMKNANISKVDSLMSKGIEVDKIIAKKVTGGKQDSLDKIAEKKTEELSELSKERQGLKDKYGKIDKQLDTISKKTTEAGGKLKEAVKDSINNIMGFREMQNNLSGYKKYTEGYLGKGFSFKSIYNKVLNNKDGSIQEGAKISKLIALNDLEKGKKVNEVYDGVFDMLKKGKQNMFLMNTKYAIDSMPISDKLNQKDFISKLENYGFQLKQDDKEELSLMWDSFQRGGPNLLGQLLEMTKGISQKYGLEKGNKLNQLIKKFINTDSNMKGADLLAKLQEELGLLGLSGEETKELITKIEKFDKNYTSLGLGFNNEMVGNIFKKEIKKPIVNKMSSLIDEAKGTAQESNIKKIKNYLENNDIQSANKLFIDLQNAGITNGENAGLYSKVENILKLANGTNGIFDKIREGLTVDDNDVNSLKTLLSSAGLENNDGLLFSNFINKIKDLDGFTKGVDNFELKAQITETANNLQDNVLSSGIYDNNREEIKRIFDIMFKGDYTEEEIAKKLEQIDIFNQHSLAYKSLTWEEKNSVNNHWSYLMGLIKNYTEVKKNLTENDYGFNEIVSTFLQKNTSQINTERYIENIRSIIDSNLFEAIDPNSSKTVEDFNKQIDLLKGQYLDNLGYDSIYKLEQIGKLKNAKVPIEEKKQIGSNIFNTLLKNKNIFNNSVLSEIEGLRNQFQSMNTEAGQTQILSQLEVKLERAFNERDMGGVSVKEMIGQINEYFNYIKGVAVKDSNEAKEIFKKKSKVEFSNELIKNSNTLVDTIAKSISSLEDGSISKLERDNILDNISDARKSINNIINTNITSEEIDANIISNTIKGITHEFKEKGLMKYINKETLGQNMGLIISSLYSEKVKNNLLENKQDNKTFIDTFYRLEKDIEGIKGIFEQETMSDLFNEDERKLFEKEVILTIGEKFLAGKDSNLLLELSNATGDKLDDYQSLLNSQLLPKGIKENILGLINNKRKKYNENISSFYSNLTKDKIADNRIKLANKENLREKLLDKIMINKDYKIESEDDLQTIYNKISSLNKEKIKHYQEIKQSAKTEKERKKVDKFIKKVKTENHLVKDLLSGANKSSKQKINGGNFSDVMEKYKTYMALESDIKNMYTDDETIENAVILQSLGKEMLSGDISENLNSNNYLELINTLDSFRNSSSTSINNKKNVLEKFKDNFRIEKLEENIENENIYYNILSEKSKTLGNIKDEVSLIEDALTNKIKNNSVYQEKISKIQNFDSLSFKEKMESLQLKDLSIDNKILEKTKGLSKLNIKTYSDIDENIKNYINDTISNISKKTNTSFKEEEVYKELNKRISNNVFNNISNMSIPNSIKEEITTLTNNKIKNIDGVNNIEELYQHISQSIDGEAKKTLFKEILSKTGAFDKYGSNIQLENNDLGQNILIEEFEEQVNNNIKNKNNKIDKITETVIDAVNNKSLQQRTIQSQDNIEEKNIIEKEVQEVQKRIKKKVEEKKNKGEIATTGIDVAIDVIKDIKEEQKNLKTDRKLKNNDKLENNIQKKRIIDNEKKVILETPNIDKKEEERITRKIENNGIKNEKPKRKNKKSDTDSLFDFN